MKSRGWGKYGDGEKPKDGDGDGDGDGDPRRGTGIPIPVTALHDRDWDGLRQIVSSPRDVTMRLAVLGLRRLGIETAWDCDNPKPAAVYFLCARYPGAENCKNTVELRCE